MNPFLNTYLPNIIYIISYQIILILIWSLFKKSKMIYFLGAIAILPWNLEEYKMIYTYWGSFNFRFILGDNFNFENSVFWFSFITLWIVYGLIYLIITKINKRRYN